MPGDEFDQYKTSPADEFDEYKSKSSTSAHIPPPTTPETKQKIDAILKGRKFEDLPLKEKTQIVALGFGEFAQQEMNKATGPESQQHGVLNHLYHRFRSLMGDVGEVALEGVAGVEDPKSATIAASGAVLPEVPAAYFGTKAAKELPEQTSTAIKNPTPENVRAPLLSASQVVAAPSGFKSGMETATTEPPKSRLQRLAQEAMNVGPRRTEDAVKGATDKYNEDVASAEEQNAAAQKDYREATVQAEQLNQDAQELSSRRGHLARGVKTLSERVRKGVERLDTEIRKKGDAKYDAVRDKIGDDEGVPVAQLAGDARYAESTFLKGSQENIKQFRELMHKAPEAGGVETSAGFVSPGDPLYDQLVEQGAIDQGGNLQFGDVRGYSSEIGSKLARGGLPGDVYQALKYMKDKLDAAAMTIAGRHDAAGDLREANAYWRQYMETFHEPTGPSGSGSPVAKILDAKDADFVAGVLTKGDSGARAMEMLSKYGADWADIQGPKDPSIIDAVKQIRDASEEMKGLPKKAKMKGLPKKAKVTKAPEKPEKKTVEPPKVDPRALKQERVEHVIETLRNMNKRDFYILAGSAIGALTLNHWFALGLASEAGMKAIGVALDRPRVIDWLSEPSAKDFSILKKLPGQVQQGAADNIRGFISEEEAKGNTVKVADSVQSWLSQFPRSDTAGSVQGDGSTPKDLKRRGKELVEAQ